MPNEKKRNLDGCYFRVQRDGKWESICFSDLTEEERNGVLEGRNEEWLKPCPFCGEIPILKYGNVVQRWWCTCDNEKCLVQPTTYAHKSKDAAKRAWKRRSDNICTHLKVFTSNQMVQWLLTPVFIFSCRNTQLEC